MNDPEATNQRSFEGLGHKSIIYLSSLGLFLMLITRRNRSLLNVLMQILPCQTKRNFDFPQKRAES